MTILLMGANGAQAATKTAKAVLSSDGKTLTFEYNDQKYNTLTTKVYMLNSGAEAPGWLENKETITTVVFGSSFRDARPTSCYQWFKDMVNLTSVEMKNPSASESEDLNFLYLNTSEVTTMKEMFSGCTNLSSLTITNFDTSKVTNMQAMFHNCRSLSSLNLSKFNTSSVENMAFMFNQCRKLQTIEGLDNFDTSNVTTMQQMFAWCSGLKQLNLPFNTSSVEHMEYMFGECTHLISADISSFVFPDDNATIGLFMGCTALSQLTVSATASNLMLSASSGALTDVGTKAYPCYLICVDGFTPEPEETGAGWFKWKGGYFTESLVAMPYAALKDNVLTFRYDDQKMALFSEGADVYPLNEALGQPGWWGCSATTVVFDPSFVEARPTSCAYWFCDMIRLTSIEGIEYLNTSEVTNMYQMFSNCYFLPQVDVSHFNTSKVENMNYMFYECYNLLTLDISNFDLPEGNTYYMFANSSINHLTIPECAAVLSENACVNMNTETNPWELICPAGFTPVPQETGDGWIKWKGGYFTVSQMEPYAALKDNELTFHYDAQKDKLASEGASVFGLNEGANKPGWEQNISLASDVTTVVFNASFAKVKPKSCAFWFNQMYNLESIEGLKYLNTSEVTTMEQMFAYCHNLRIVDVSQFNTSKVENMKYMFYECANLFNLDISNFDLPTENTDGMFAKSSINYLTIPDCADVLNENACESMNTETNPWELICPAGFTPEPQQTGHGWMKWKSGYFTVVHKELYTILEDNVLTFKHDLMKPQCIAEGYTVFELNDAETAPAWYNNGAVVTKVIFDDSFARAKPVSCRSWFYGMLNLQVIEGLENLNTSEVTTMRSMFNGCIRLESLDLSHFDTSLVKDMGFMFMNCSNLMTIEGLDKFDTSKVTTMQQMFALCSGLKQLNLPFNTSSVEIMSFMFAECTSLVAADISSFDFPDVNSNDLFRGCTALSQLTVSATAADLIPSDDTSNSGSLLDVGTQLSPCYLICVDGFTPEPEETGEGWFKWKGGYFSESAVSAYATLKENVLTFRYDDQKVALAIGGENVSCLNVALAQPGWQKDQSQVKRVIKVVFDPSFVEARPTSCAYWFNNMYNLQTIEGMEYLNTSEVTNMHMMFCNCRYLRQVDVSHFNTSKVKNMNQMFNECRNLTTLDFSNFDLPADNTDRMFVGASINYLAVPTCAETLVDYACYDMGSQEYPWKLICPSGFTPVPQETGDGWIKWKGGYFCVCPMGDANSDGRVTVADVMLAVNKVLGKPVSNFNMLASDMNKDSIITVADIMQIVKTILVK